MDDLVGIEIAEEEVKFADGSMNVFLDLKVSF